MASLMMDAFSEYRLELTGRGTCLETKYSVLPKPTKITKEDTEAMA